MFGPKNLCWHLGTSKESTERPKHSVNGVELKTQSQVPNTRHEEVPVRNSSVGATKNLTNDTAGGMEMETSPRNGHMVILHCGKAIYISGI